MRLTLSRLCFVVTLAAAGCLSEVEFDGYRCDNGICSAGFECNPSTDQCVAAITVGCTGVEDVCPDDIVGGGDCTPVGAFVPCGDGELCAGGCAYTCTASGWDDCVSGDCTPGEVISCADCSNDCTASVMNAVPLCDISGTSPVCDYEACDTGSFDTDNNPTNGCECTATGADISCNGIDEDCVDGDLENLGTVTDCTACGDVCTATPGTNVSAVRCSFATGSATCAVETCDAGFTDTDGSLSNGCEDSCTPTPDPTEVCDNTDNDCNGVVDDGFNTGDTCGVGECAGGVFECDGTGTRCSREAGGSDDRVAAEVCDDLDHDCDGDNFNGFDVGDACGAGDCGGGLLECTADTTDTQCDTEPGGTSDASSPEICDNGDNNCDGTVDEGLGAACGCTDGLAAPTGETCDDVDNDCNGIVDDGFTVGQACGAGQCANGLLECRANGSGTLCSTEVGGSADATSAEVCDNVDNNCDAATDEAVPNCACDGGSPSAEICDGIDNDCNQAVDDVLDINAHCSGLNLTATDVAQWACGGGTCAISTCAAGMVNADGLINNGCELPCVPTPNPTEVCDTLDNDCNGTADDGFATGVSCGQGDCTGGVTECDGPAATRCSTESGGSNDLSTAEACDGLDNDCDGTVPANEADADADGFRVCEGDCDDDNAFGCGDQCFPGNPALDLCDGDDQNCNGATDEDYVSDNTCFLVGVCAAGNVASSCTNGTEILCATGNQSGIAESFCNGDDDNCDGATDEDYVSDVTCFLPGECAAGNTASTCITGSETACTPGATTGIDDDCDGLDDNCDGANDENYVPDATCGLGVCQTGNTPSSCSLGSETACAPGAPTGADDDCNDVDDNCSGTPDDAYVPDATCGVGECLTNNTPSSCTGGAVTPCAPGAPAGEVCVNGLDENCNGVDDDCCDLNTCFADADCTPAATGGTCVDAVDDCSTTACAGLGTIEGGQPTASDFPNWQSGESETTRGSQRWYCSSSFAIDADGLLTDWELFVDNHGSNGEVAQLAVIRCATGGAAALLSTCTRVGLGPSEAVTGDGQHTFSLAGSTQLDAATPNAAGIVVQAGDWVCADSDRYDIGVDCDATTNVGGCPGPNLTTQLLANLDTAGEPFTLGDSVLSNGYLMIKAAGLSLGTCTDLLSEADTTLCNVTGGDTCCAQSCVVGNPAAGTCP